MMAAVRRALLLVLAALSLTLSSSLTVSAAAAQSQAPCPVEDGTVVNPDAAGTAATGACAPPRSDRLVDSAIWIFTLGVLVAVVVLVLRGSRQPSGAPVEDR